MIKAMSPPGVDDETTRKLLAGATLDAVQLPGRFNTTAEDGPSSVAEAIAELAEDKRGEWAGDGLRRDVQWKSANRTSLKTITSQETLQERHTELQGLKGDVYENQVNAYQAILSDLHWSEASIIAWSQLNWYQRLGSDTFEYYTNLHLHLIELSLKQGWAYAAISLAHHTAKLANIRAQAPSRLCCLVRIYIYLRDANRQSFYSEKLQEKRNREVMEEISSLKALGSGGSTSGGGSNASCKKCGMGLHSGGTRNCPYKALPDAEARKKMKALWEQLGKMSTADWTRLLEAGE
jgi:ATP-dependent protease HslVU (ClpYQ) peptidase subunit